jgi:nucleoid-associated protein YgaU
MSVQLQAAIEDEQFFTRPLVGNAAFAGLLGFNPDDLGLHEVVAGETLPTIATAWYGPARAGLWTLIAQANGLLGPNTLVSGSLVRIPDPGWRAV